MLCPIKDIDKRKCIVNYMVRDSCSTVSKWHQLVDFVWYDCLIRVEMMTLTVLLRLDFHLVDNHHHKKAWRHHQRYGDGVIRSIKTLQEAWNRDAHTKPFKRIRLILIIFWLKLWRGMLRPPVQTSFCARNKHVWLQRS